MPAPARWLASPLNHLRKALGLSRHTTDADDASVLREHFRQRAAERQFTLSAGQLRVIDAFASRIDTLQDPDARKPPRSLYLYGSVGRGKSWLLDGFYQAIGHPQKLRLHFHDFFARLHEGMFRHSGNEDSLGIVLDELLADCRLLCFDEFHVHDIGDAMLIKRLFAALFERGIFLLVTSNYAPNGLLPNPLYHQRFLPVIRLIEGRMEVLEVSGEQDYRALPQAGAEQQFTQGRYLWPGNPDQRRALALENTAPAPLAVGNRHLMARTDDARITFDFAAICEQPTAVIDYLDLGERFDHWVIDGLPKLQDCPIATQQRFINLIDVLYDQDKHLVLIGEHPLDDCLDGKALDLARTRSRLGQLEEVGP